MELQRAIEIMKKFVEIDRVIREDNCESDYDKFCEERCVAVETILKELEAKKVMGEEAKKIETGFMERINKSLGINQFAEMLYKSYPNIPKDKLLSVTRGFLENLELLNKIYNVPKEMIEDIDSHIPHAD